MSEEAAVLIIISALVIVVVCIVVEFAISAYQAGQEELPRKKRRDKIVEVKNYLKR